MKHTLRLMMFCQGDVLIFPSIHPEHHQRIAKSLSTSLFKPIGFTVNSHTLGLWDSPNPTLNPDEPERFCLGLCQTLTAVPFYAQKPFVFL